VPRECYCVLGGNGPMATVRRERSIAGGAPVGLVASSGGGRDPGQGPGISSPKARRLAVGWSRRELSQALAPHEAKG